MDFHGRPTDERTPHAAQEIQPGERGDQGEPAHDRPPLSERAGPAQLGPGREQTLHPEMQLALGLEMWPTERDREETADQWLEPDVEPDSEPVDELRADEHAPDLYLVETTWSELDEAAPAWPPGIEGPSYSDAIWGSLVEGVPEEPQARADEPPPTDAQVEDEIDVWPWEQADWQTGHASVEADQPATAEVAPPEDVRELRLLGDDELEEVGRGLLEVLDPEAWAKADIPERMRMAQHAHAFIQDAYGLESAPLLYDMNLPSQVAGRYDPTSGLVTVNPSLLEDDHPGELLDTLAHESRHTVQVELVGELRGAWDAGRNEPDRGGVDWAAVGRWGDAMTRYDANDAVAYHSNELEVDARRAGLQLAGNGYWRAYMEKLAE